MSASEVDDVSGDGGVTKRVLIPGDGALAGAGSRVTLRYEMRLASASEPFDSSEGRPGGTLAFRLGRGKAILGLELLAMSMAVGEKVEATLTPQYAFGKGGLKRCGVPGDAVVELKVEMVEVEHKEKVKGLAEMTATERLGEAVSCKERGNNLFNEAKLEKAASEYQRCLRYIEYIFYRPSEVGNDASGLPARANAKRVVEHQGDSEAYSAAATSGQTESQAVAETKAETEADGEEQLALPNGAQEEAEVDCVAYGQTSLTPLKETEEEADAEANSPAPSTPPKGTEEEGEESPGSPATEEDGADHDKEDEIEEIDATGDTQTQGPVHDAPFASSEGAQNDESGFGFVEAALEDDGVDKVENERTEEGDGDDGGDDSNDPGEDEVREVHIAALNNLSLCLLKLGNNKEVVKMSSLSIAMDPLNHKPLYYRGRARIAMGSWEEAKEDLLAAAKIAPNQMGIRVALAEVNKKMKNHLARERKAAAAMFA
jgi:tetratricopeptide (TPR) repeat protein